MLLVEGPWEDAPAAIAAMSADPVRAVGAEGADVAVYWPRIRRDRGGTVTEVSPLGPVAGVFARTDSQRGVHVAPAGASGALHGGIEPVATATSAEQATLNEVGVNLLRTLPDVGTVVWGARTRSSDAEWKYVPVRRTLQFLETSIDRGLGWVVFEPNSEALWYAVTGAIQDFLLRMWQQGVLQGTRPDEAFFVRCDRTTMTQNDLADGRLVCSIGVAPVRPAEFVIFAIGRWTADAPE
jgi:phage tail sheath protein FI